MLCWAPAVPAVLAVPVALAVPRVLVLVVHRALELAVAPVRRPQLPVEWGARTRARVEPAVPAVPAVPVAPAALAAAKVVPGSQV